MTDYGYRDRTDSVEDKLKLLESAYANGRHDLAMSIAESIRETLKYERQSQAPAEDTDLFQSVEALPPPWQEWAQGWRVFQPITLFETVGIDRKAEPLEVPVRLRVELATVLNREIRVAQVDASTGSLIEVRCQVSEEFCRRGGRGCGIVLAADVPAHGNTTYLIFAGNPFAELPEYRSDLRVSGEDCRIDIANHHYLARLSRQSGQLERLTFARQHGHELYAGGKGHGEPPGIDWGHDYVDAGGFQKLRMRNWSACPNYEVVQGPLCVKVRRWGFPHSPLHPLFTPSRVHMDVEYTFYSGVPYFLKQSRFDVVKDVPVEAMRDDEWVFSGYSFSQMLWIDRHGKLHEGSVPAADSNDLWGVGFVNSTSRDLFIALRLSHEADHFDGLRHGGVPTLHYEGHGQLWSRYPVDAKVTLRAGASIRQTNAYLLGEYPQNDPVGRIAEIRHQLMNPITVQIGEMPKSIHARSHGMLARPGELEETRPRKTEIWKVLSDIKDEQLYTIDAGIVDLGYVYDVRVRDGIVEVVVTMPHRGRPVYDFLVTQGGGRVSEGIRERLLKLDGVRDVIVKMTWNPPWSVHRVSELGRRALLLPDH